MFRRKSGPTKAAHPQMSSENPVPQKEKPQKMEKKEATKEPEKEEVLSAEDAIWAERSKPYPFHSIIVCITIISFDLSYACVRK